MRNSSSGAIFYHTKNHFSSVQRAVLHTVIEASNSSCQERRFRPKDADLVIKFYFFWPYIGQKRPRNRGKFLLPLRYELTPEGLIWPSNRTILTPLQTKTTPSFSQNSPVMKSFRLPHTRPFLPHFAEAISETICGSQGSLELRSASWWKKFLYQTKLKRHPNVLFIRCVRALQANMQLLLQWLTVEPQIEKNRGYATFRIWPFWVEITLWLLE